MSKHIKYMNPNSAFIDKLNKRDYCPLLYSLEFARLIHPVDLRLSKTGSFSVSEL